MGKLAHIDSLESFHRRAEIPVANSVVGISPYLRLCSIEKNSFFALYKHAASLFVSTLSSLGLWSLSFYSCKSFIPLKLHPRVIQGSFRLTSIS